MTRIPIEAYLEMGGGEGRFFVVLSGKEVDIIPFGGRIVFTQPWQEAIWQESVLYNANINARIDEEARGE
jgi:hypothetical protein